jgi:hypothetical protein
MLMAYLFLDRLFGELIQEQLLNIIIKIEQQLDLVGCSVLHGLNILTTMEMIQIIIDVRLKRQDLELQTSVGLHLIIDRLAHEWLLIFKVKV